MANVITSVLKSAKMGLIKDRNGMELIEAEDMKVYIVFKCKILSIMRFHCI